MSLLEKGLVLRAHLDSGIDDQSKHFYPLPLDTSKINCFYHMNKFSRRRYMKDMDMLNSTGLYRLQEGRVTHGILFLCVHAVPMCVLTHTHVYHASEGDSSLAGSRKTAREFFCLLIFVVSVGFNRLLKFLLSTSGTAFPSMRYVR